MATSEPPKSPGWASPTDNAGRGHWYRRRSRREQAREDMLRDWYGDELAAREIEANQKRERHVDELVDDLLRSWHQDERIVLRELIDRWEEVVGAAFVRHCQPASLQNGCLQVEVFNGVIRFRLEAVRAELTEKARGIAGDAVSSVRFIAGGRSPRRPS